MANLLPRKKSSDGFYNISHSVCLSNYVDRFPGKSFVGISSVLNDLHVHSEDALTISQRQHRYIPQHSWPPRTTCEEGSQRTRSKSYLLNMSGEVLLGFSRLNCKPHTGCFRCRRLCSLVMHLHGFLARPEFSDNVLLLGLCYCHLS